MTDQRLVPELWRVADVARDLGVHADTLVQASRKAEFPPLVRIGRRWFVHADAVRDWVKRQHATTMPEARVEAIRASVRQHTPTPLRRRIAP